MFYFYFGWLLVVSWSKYHFTALQFHKFFGHKPTHQTLLIYSLHCSLTHSNNNFFASSISLSQNNNQSFWQNVLVCIVLLLLLYYTPVYLNRFIFLFFFLSFLYFAVYYNVECYISNCSGNWNDNNNVYFVQLLSILSSCFRCIFRFWNSHCMRIVIYHDYCYYFDYKCNECVINWMERVAMLTISIHATIIVLI